MARRFVSLAHRVVGLLLVMVHLLFGSAVSAQSTATDDTVVLTDGQRLRGTVIKILPDGAVEIATSSGVQQVPAAQVAQVQLAEARVAGASPILLTQAPRRPTLQLQQETRMSWYGYQTLLADGASVGMLATGLALLEGMQTQELGGSFGAVGVFSYLLGAPAVHLVHGEVGRAFGDLAIRVGGPVLFTTMGLIVAGSIEKGRETAERGTVTTGVAIGVAGSAIGIVAPIVIDASVLAYEKKPVADAKLRLLPTAAITPTGLTGGLSGQF